MRSPPRRAHSLACALGGGTPSLLRVSSHAASLPSHSYGADNVAAVDFTAIRNQTAAARAAAHKRLNSKPTRKRPRKEKEEAQRPVGMIRSVRQAMAASLGKGPAEVWAPPQKGQGGDFVKSDAKKARPASEEQSEEEEEKGGDKDLEDGAAPGVTIEING